MRALFLAASLLLPSAALADDTPDNAYAMDELGITLTLPKGWTPERGSWSDGSLRARSLDNRFRLYVWGDAIQVGIDADDAEAWGTVHRTKAVEQKGSDIEILSARVVEVGGRDTARLSLRFDFAGDLEGVMEGATFTTAGHTVHYAVVAASSRAVLVPEVLDGMLEATEVRSPPAELAWGAQVSGEGVTSTLPDDWRLPLESEATPVRARLRLLGLEDVGPECWTAISPLAARPPKVMVGCPLPHRVGVLDSYSAEAVEADLRALFFADAEVAPAETLDLGDRLGLLWQVSPRGESLAVAAVPFEGGLVHVQAFGGAGKVDDVVAAVRTVAEEGTFTGDHPVSSPEWVAYYVSYRPLVPAGLAFLGLLVLGLGIWLVRKQGAANPDLDLSE